jgi:multicomponent Na+:H+ antiporter subunit D
VDRRGYVAEVLRGVPAATPSVTGPPGPTALDYLYGGLSTVGAVGLAWLALFPGRLSVPAAAITPLRRLHSGRIGDYVSWLAVGVTAFGGLFAVTILPHG